MAKILNGLSHCTAKALGVQKASLPGFRLDE